MMDVVINFNLALFDWEIDLITAAVEIRTDLYKDGKMASDKEKFSIYQPLSKKLRKLANENNKTEKAYNVNFSVTGNELKEIINALDGEYWMYIDNDIIDLGLEYMQLYYRFYAIAEKLKGSIKEEER